MQSDMSDPNRFASDILSDHQNIVISGPGTYAHRFGWIKSTALTKGMHTGSVGYKRYRTNKRYAHRFGWIKGATLTKSSTHTGSVG